MMKIRLSLMIILSATLFLESAPALDAVKVFLPDGSSITAELAVSMEERMLGLMFREVLNEDQGMLFVFEDEAAHAIWMKNMKFSIDILWIDAAKRIVHIEPQVPPCRKDPCPSYAPQTPALYVLELKSGCAEKNGLRIYDRLEFILPKSLRRTDR